MFVDIFWDKSNLKLGYKINFQKQTSNVNELPTAFQKVFVSTECPNF